MAEPGAIFISYRRSDAGGYAWALRDYLTLRFDPDTLFFDRETIDTGTVFPDRLRAAIEGCQVLLAVIAPDWLEAKDDNGRRRLDDEDDWVRREIALALAFGKTVIPVLFGDNTQPPPADRLPEPLQPLASLQVKRLRGDFSEYDAQRQDLVRVLGQVPGVPTPRPDQTRPVIGIPPEQVASLIAAANEPLAKLTAQQQETIRELERQTGVSEGALRTFFRTLGEQEVPPERYAEKLGEIAERYRTLVAEIATMPAEEPELVRLKEAADAAMQAGDLNQASALHVEMLALQDQASDRAWQEAERKRLDAAATAARLGEFALTGLRYLEAARHFAAAASRVPPGYEDDRLRYLDAEAHALFLQGEKDGDSACLRLAVERYRALLALRPRDREMRGWAITQNGLGLALKLLGQLEQGLDSLFAAKEVFRATLRVLEEPSNARLHSLRRAIHSNFATVLQDIGIWEGSIQHLLQARHEFETLLATTSRVKNPSEWASTQYNIGVTILSIADKQNSSRLTKQAVRSFRKALKKSCQKRRPLFWAQVQNALGAALVRVGERENSTRYFVEAVTAFHAALEERKQHRVPLEWAETQNNLGGALKSLGDLNGELDVINAAIEALEGALKERRRERTPRKWAETLYNLAQVLFQRALVDNDVKWANACIEAATEALQERPREHMPLHWARTKHCLGQAFLFLGVRHRSELRLLDARMAFEEALSEITRERAPHEWCIVQHSLGKVYLAFSTLKSGSAGLADAKQAEWTFRNALDPRIPLHSTQFWAMVTWDMAEALLIIGDHTHDIATLDEAKNARVRSWRALNHSRQRSSPDELQGFLQKVDIAIITIRKRPWLNEDR